MTGALSAGSCDRRTKRSQEELAHVRGQGQKPGGPNARRAAAKRSYPTSEVMGSGRECQAATVQERSRGATPEARDGARRSYPTPPSPRPGAAAGEDQPHAQGAVATQAQEGLEELSHVEGQEGQQ